MSVWVELKSITDVRMPRRKRINVNMARNKRKLKKVLDLSDKGTSVRNIAYIMNIPKSSVHDIIKNRNKEPGGRLVVLTNEEEKATIIFQCCTVRRKKMIH